MKKGRFKKSVVGGIFMGAALAGFSVEPLDTVETLREQILKTRGEPLTHLDVRATMNVRDFGALPDDGKDDHDAVKAAVEKAHSMNGPVQIDFEPGVYDFGPGTPDFLLGRENTAIRLQNCRNLIIDGQGAEFRIHRQDVSVIWADSSSNLIFRNFSVDYDPLPFSQGTVVEVSPADADFVLELHPGFPPPDDPFFLSCNSQGISWGILKDASQPGRLKANVPSFFEYRNIRSLGDGRFRIGLAQAEQIASFEVGDAFVINGRSASIGRYYGSDNLTFDHVTIYSCPSPLFIGAETSRLNILNCVVRLKGNRLITNGGGGVICQSSRVGPWVENCDFEGLSDDCMNLYGLPIFILSRASPTEMTVHARAGIQPGDELVFFDPNEGRIIQETTAVSFSGNRLVVSDPVGEMNLAPPGAEALGHEKAWKGYDHIYNLNTTGRGFVYRNNYMHDGRRYGVLLRTGFGLVENNRFEGLSLPGLRIANEPGWPEGFWARDLVIQDNRVSECGYSYGGPAVQVAGCRLGGSMSVPIQKNIYFLGNVFEAVSGPALELSGVSGLVAEGNTFMSGSPTGPLITIQYSDNVTLKNNRGQDRIEMQNMNDDGILSNEK
ncbi:MAG: right-handed parallel beta-helix repeat-containing protein [Kiritimatiellales bacterium]